MRIMIKVKRWVHFLLTGVAILLLSACGRANLLNLLVPRSGYTMHSNIAYGKHPRQKLDIYVPEKLSKDSPILLFFYGGSWQYGSKDQYRFIGEAFASQGIITVIADYRLYPTVYFPSFINDSAKAMVWVHKHIKSYGGNPDNVFLVGHSAGAFNVVMLTINDTYLTQEGGKLAWIKGTVGIAGPYDFLPFTDPTVKAIFSRVNEAMTQPINFVTSGLPPLLLVTGSEDTEVYPKNAINLYDKLRTYHNPVQLIVYPHIGHIGIIVSLAYGFRWKSTLLTDITHFVRKNQVNID